MNQARRPTIVGVGQLDFGALAAQRDVVNDPIALGARAFALALEDAGLAKSAIDGLVTARIPYGPSAEAFGMKDLWLINGLEGSGRMSGVAVQYAAAMIESGQADTVALVYGNNGRSAQMTYGGEAAYDPTSVYNQYHGMTSAGAAVAMLYRRYCYEFGVDDGALAPLAINNRHNAALNPGAVMKNPITFDEYMAGRYIAEPLRLFDYCIINDGAVAIIMTTIERARDLRKRPVQVAAKAARAEVSNHYWSRDFFFENSRKVAQRLGEQAGIAPADVDVLQIYDNFTPVVAFSLEGFGFAERGQGARWATLDQIGLRGRQPLNTAGGHTGESYMQGWAHHVEAVRQIRGECGERQVPEVDVAQYICVSPIITSHILVGE